MRKNRLYQQISFFIVFIFIFTPFNSLWSFNFEKGFSFGFAYESVEKNSQADESEMGGMVFDFQLIGRVRIKKRVQVFPVIGYKASSDKLSGLKDSEDAYQVFYAGAKVGWIIYPFYFPFIGASLYVNYYDKFLDLTDKTVLTINFTAGSKIVRLADSDVWLFFEMGIFNSEYGDYVFSSFSISLSYLFH